MDCRSKMEDADAQYKQQQKKTTQTHAEYYESHLPKIIKVIRDAYPIRSLLKETIGFKSSR